MTTIGDGPEISVIMPAWRSAKFIKDSIASVQAQLDIQWELIVVDDASPDNTADIVKALAASDSRIRLEILSKNQGPAAARNRAIDLSSAPFVAVLDDDDTMHASRLRTLVDLAETEGADIVVDNMLEVDDEPSGEVIGRFLSLPDDGQSKSISLAEYLDPGSEAKLGGSIGYLKPVFRRSALSVRYDESLRNSEDFYLVAELLARGSAMTLSPKALYRYTRRRGSLSWRLSAENAASIVAAHEAFDKRHLSKLEPRQIRASRRLLRERRDRMAFAMLVDALKSRRLGGTIAAFLGRPRSLPFMLMELSRIMREKLFARSAPAST